MSEHSFEDRLHACVVSGWWTVLIFMVLITLQWLMSLIILRTQPEFMVMWLGGMDWVEIRSLIMHSIATAKIVMLGFLFAVIWMTLWDRRLSR